jgi:hypothetical protein
VKKTFFPFSFDDFKLVNDSWKIYCFDKTDETEADRELQRQTY